jgi:hypothetical protein
MAEHKTPLAALDAESPAVSQTRVSPLQRLAAQLSALPNYPPEFEQNLAQARLSSDFAALRRTHGKYIVMLGRFQTGGLSGFITTTSVLRFDLFHRCTQAIDAGTVLPLIPQEDRYLFEGRETVLVCTPPLAGEHVRSMADCMMSETFFLEQKMQLIANCNTMLLLDTDAAPVVGTLASIALYLNTKRDQYTAMVEAMRPAEITFVEAENPYADNDDMDHLREVGWSDDDEKGDDVEGGAVADGALAIEQRVISAASVAGLTAADPTTADSSAADSTTADSSAADSISADPISTQAPATATVTVAAIDNMCDELEKQKRAELARLRTELAVTIYDRINASIKKLSISDVRIFPPVPPVEDSEIAALVHIIQLLHAPRRPDAKAILRNALNTPQFAGLCRLPEILALERNSDESMPYIDAIGYLNMLERSVMAMRDRRIPCITPESPFIFTLEQVIAMKIAHAPPNVATAVWRLDQFVGGYLADLDLSQTLITGSAIAASLILTEVETSVFQVASAAANAAANAAAAVNAAANAATNAHHADAYRAYLNAHYPTVRTVPRNRAAYSKLARTAMVSSDANFTLVTAAAGASSAPTCTLTISVEPVGESKGSPAGGVVLDVLPGADVDMVIIAGSWEEFDAITARHFSVIHARYPFAVLRKKTRALGRAENYSWAIEVDLLSNAGVQSISSFRTVEMYRSSFDNICSHHVGMVCGAYTAMFDKKSQFLVSTRLVIAMRKLTASNYDYFAGRKSQPLDILLKYEQRGFNIDCNPAIMRSIEQFRDAEDRTNWKHTKVYGKGFECRSMALPALFAYGGTYSAYSLVAEADLYLALHPPAK